MPLFPWKRNGGDEEYRADHNYPPSQEHVLARFVRDGVLALKDNTLVAVVGVGPIDLSLMLPEERGAKLLQYEEVLKELRFAYQIIVATKPQHVESYLAYLEQCAETQHQAGRYHWADLARDHALLVRNFARRANAQLRHFLIAVAYEDPVWIAKRAAGRLTELSPAEFEKGQRELSRRTSHLVLALQRIGLEAWRLDDHELAAELANFYHPRLPRQSAVSDDFFATTLLPFATSGE